PVSTATGIPGASIRVAGAPDAMAIARTAKVLYAASGSNVLTVRSLAASPSQQAGFQVMSMSYITKHEGWALGTVGCKSGRCLQLLHTTNGISWAQLRSPAIYPASFGVCPTQHPCVQQIAFVGTDGYAFAPSSMVSTDSGSNWNAGSGTYVSSLAASAGGFVAPVTSQAARCIRPPYVVQGATGGPAAWPPFTPQPAISRGFPPVSYILAPPHASCGQL